MRPLVGWGESDYLDEVERRINWVRWVEYSFSATTMILAVAFVLNIQDVGSVAMLATSTAVTQLFGLVGELMLERKQGNYRTDLFIPADRSPVRMDAVAFFAIFVSYFQSVEEAASNGGEEPPAFVYTLVLSMAILFGSFGLVQPVGFVKTMYRSQWTLWMQKEPVLRVCRARRLRAHVHRPITHSKNTAEYPGRRKFVFRHGLKSKPICIYCSNILKLQ